MNSHDPGKYVEKVWATNHSSYRYEHKIKKYEVADKIPGCERMAQLLG